MIKLRLWQAISVGHEADILYAIHEPHLPKDGLAIYRGISGEQFHGSKAS